ncbi:hypothetical protein BT63DRAFT_409675 [Microthyrium microscopicum]|uniref:Thioredoxin domain-containing protein n=1 Tax=Microthyrium microscopicum TaxID=703497 RepID=A0A6A6UK00_9PEZI|nr:hypothetical protein BT63DRAFT_409675 [Microthyrium microscopicum]
MATAEVQSQHTQLHSKEDFQKAVGTKDKYVIIFAHTGEIPEKAENAAKAYAHNTASFSVDVEKFPAAKENLKLTEFPSAIVFKDGAEIKRAEGLNPEKAKELMSVLV